MSAPFRIILSIASVILSFGSSYPQTSNRNSSYAIRNAKVYTMGPSGTLDRATVVVVDGKIREVGPNARIPSGARIIEGRGLEVYPGMINAWGNLGLTEIGAVPATVDTTEMGNFNPHLLAFSAIHPASEHIPVARVNGITSSLTAPDGALISGQAVLFHLDGWTADEMVIRKSAGMVLTFPSLSRRGGGFGGGPGGRGGRRQSFGEIKREYENRVKELSEFWEKARHYEKAQAADPSTTRDRVLEAMIPVVRGQMPVFVAADTARDIKNAVEFAKKEKIRMVLQGGRETGKVAELLKQENIPVILDSIVALPAREDDPYDSRFSLPAELARAGVKFALTSPSSSDTRNLPYEAGFAQAYGLSHEQALAAVTRNPAEILGVADILGSVEPGKLADLVVTDGDLLELRTQVKTLLINGKEVSLETKHTKLYETYLNRP